MGLIALGVVTVGIVFGIIVGNIVGKKTIDYNNKQKNSQVDKVKETTLMWSLFFCVYIIFAVIYRKPYLLYKTKAKRGKELIKQNYYIDGNTVRKISYP